jgi:hypothetical protein
MVISGHTKSILTNHSMKTYNLKYITLVNNLWLPCYHKYKTSGRAIMFNGPQQLVA